MYSYTLRFNRVFYVYILFFLFQCKGHPKLLLRLSKLTYYNFFSAFITCVICCICQCWKLCTMYMFEIKFVLFCSVLYLESSLKFYPHRKCCFHFLFHKKHIKHFLIYLVHPPFDLILFNFILVAQIFSFAI